MTSEREPQAVRADFFNAFGRYVACLGQGKEVASERWERVIQGVDAFEAAVRRDERARILQVVGEMLPSEYERVSKMIAALSASEREEANQ